MNGIPDYKAWMKDTQVAMRKRSPKLKELDLAIKAQPQNKEAVKKALDAWRFDQSRQGKDWRKSSRNKKGAVTALARVVNPDKRRLSAEEIEALKFIARAQSKALRLQFDSKQVKFKGHTLAGMLTDGGPSYDKIKATLRDGSFVGNAKEAKGTVQGARENIASLKTVSGIVKAGRPGGMAKHISGARGDTVADFEGKIMKVLKLAAGKNDPAEIFKIGKINVSPRKLAQDVAPFIGAATSGAKCIKAWTDVAKKAYQKHNYIELRSSFAPQDPAAAFEAIELLLKREIAAKTATASVATASFGGKLVGTFVDGGTVSGPVMGIIEAIASIIQTVVEISIELTEMKKANELMRLGALNMDLFKVCPILGCYFLNVQDHSTIINYAVGDYGKDNFVFDAERLVKKIEPVLDQSREYIHASRICIPKMENCKGIINEGFRVKTGLAKVSALPAHLADNMFNKIEDFIENPVKPPLVDPTRIQGYGHQPGGGFGRG